MPDVVVVSLAFRPPPVLRVDPPERLPDERPPLVLRLLRLADPVLRDEEDEPPLEEELREADDPPLEDVLREEELRLALLLRPADDFFAAPFDEAFDVPLPLELAFVDAFLVATPRLFDDLLAAPFLLAPFFAAPLLLVREAELFFAAPFEDDFLEAAFFVAFAMFNGFSRG